MKQFCVSACATLFCLAAASGAHAADSCSAHLAPPGLVSLNLDSPLTGDPDLDPFTLRLRDISDNSCRFTIAFEQGVEPGGLHGDGGELTFHLARDAAGSDTLYDSRQPNVERAVHVRDEVRLFFIAYPGQSPRAGAYQSSVFAVLRSADGASELDRQPLGLRAAIPPHVQAFLSGAGQSSNGSYALLDFQQLTRGERGHATLRIRSTSDVDVSFESENHGALENESDPSYRVGYQLSADGQLLDLRRESAISRSASSAAARDIGLDVEIGDTSHALAGAYRDRITVTVSAR